MHGYSLIKFVLLAFALGAAASPSSRFVAPEASATPTLIRRNGGEGNGGGRNDGNPSAPGSNGGQNDQQPGKSPARRTTSQLEARTPITPKNREMATRTLGEATTRRTLRPVVRIPARSSGKGSTSTGGKEGGKAAEDWDDGSTTTQPSNPQPSARLHTRRVVKKRDPKDMSGIELAQHVCPKGFFGCPIAEPGSLTALPSNLDRLLNEGFECFDLKVDLRACGGCAALNKV
ncbi:hypothetical protein DFP72DRAFT_30166 [Ephemerocybe angulata]|uniref:Uncharacterized protein n=1 Tax=Ephemerocybe angulata TaxID=980116 RepID=A0A8H6MHL5_9AGAR|nr:hypothetical protein DFP72DRAFT_30166 [Tulosesus angulatus]